MHASLLVPALPVPHQLHPLAAQELQLPLPGLELQVVQAVQVEPWTDSRLAVGVLSFEILNIDRINSVMGAISLLIQYAAKKRHPA